MNEMLLLLLVVIIALVSGFLISTLLEIRKAAKELGRFLNTAEGSIMPAVEELNGTMKSLKTTLDEISEVTRDIKTFSSAMGEVSDNVRQINNFVGNVPALIAGVTAGIKSVVEYYTRPRAGATVEESKRQEP